MAQILNLTLPSMGKSMGGESWVLQVHPVLVCVISPRETVQGAIVVDDTVSWSDWPICVLRQREIWEWWWIIVLSQVPGVDPWSNDFHIVSQLTEVFELKNSFKTLRVDATLYALNLRSVFRAIGKLRSGRSDILLVKLANLIISFVLVMDFVLQSVEIVPKTAHLGNYLVQRQRVDFDTLLLHIGLVAWLR